MSYLKEYIDQNHPDAFVDFPGKREPAYGMTKECPVCKGYGGWNLELNAYSLHNEPDTPENRHRYSHFRASCSHCNGWGYVAPEENCTGHKWIHVRNEGRCLNRYRCIVCNKETVLDSSD